MRRIGRCLLAVALAALAGACAAPLSLVGFAGSTVAKTARNYSEAEKEAQPRRHAIAEANVALAVEYMRHGRYEDALFKLEKARQAEPRHAGAHSMLGLLYQQLGRADLAETNFRKSLQLDKGNPEYLNNYGQFLCLQGRYDEAEQTFLTAAQDPLYQTPEAAFANAGTCAMARQDRSRARLYFSTALKHDPALPAALISMSEIEYAGGDYAAADGYLRRFAAVAAHTPRSLWLGIRIYRRTGNADAGASYALLLRGKFPQSEEAQRLDSPGGLQEALALEQPPAQPQAGLLDVLGHLVDPEPLTAKQLLRDN